MRWKGFIGLVIILGLTCCSRKPESPLPSPVSAAPAPLAQSALVTGDVEGLRDYLQTVQEAPARRFDVEWNPDVVAVDRASALRSLRGLSPDGWAKLLGKALNSTLADISNAASVRQQVFKKEWYRTEPDIKGCHIK